LLNTKSILIVIKARDNCLEPFCCFATLTCKVVTLEDNCEEDSSTVVLCILYDSRIDFITSDNNPKIKNLLQMCINITFPAVLHVKLYQLMIDTPRTLFYIYIEEQNCVNKFIHCLQMAIKYHDVCSTV
jgi:hypothetical protein